MDYKTIVQLLDKYWEGQTSLEEEKELKTFFQQNDIPAEFQTYTSYFRFLHQEKQLGLPADFRPEMSKIAETAPPKYSIGRWIAAAAAIGLVLITTVILQEPKPSVNVVALDAETYEDPEEAYNKAKELLLLVSSKMNQGTAAAAEGVIQVKALSTASKTLKQ